MNRAQIKYAQDRIQRAYNKATKAVPYVEPITHLSQAEINKRLAEVGLISTTYGDILTLEENAKKVKYEAARKEMLDKLTALKDSTLDALLLGDSTTAMEAIEQFNKSLESINTEL